MRRRGEKEAFDGRILGEGELVERILAEADEKATGWSQDKGEEEGVRGFWGRGCVRITG